MVESDNKEQSDSQDKAPNKSPDKTNVNNPQLKDFIRANEALKIRIGKISEDLCFKETMKIRAITQNLPKPYYYSWSKDSNSYFGVIVTLDKRRRKYEKMLKAAQKAS